MRFHFACYMCKSISGQRHVPSFLQMDMMNIEYSDEPVEPMPPPPVSKGE